ncbi:hypothetical protein DFH27DRAFT_476157 [Peziza echinospora]|nr:hypothetical protein DFH27DRAFT_476157 [Peziza echinospora]
MSSGIAARRQHPSLPAFQLPSNSNSGSRGYSNLGSVMTPPGININDGGNSLNSASGNMATVTSGGYSSPQSYWTAPPPNPASFAFGSASGSNPSYTSSSGINHGFRSMYAPSSINRGNSRPSSPSTNNMLNSQQYDSPSQYTSSTSGLPSLGQGSLHHHYATGYPVSSGPSQSPINTHSQSDLYTHSSLPPPTPSHSYYSQSSFNNSPSASHVLSMPTSQSLSRSLMPSNSASSPPYPHHPPIHPAPSHLGLQRYPLAHMGSMPIHYPGMMHPGMPQQERPFKCDQCPQSFNRNHDLKRHKRIHLAVKPFPCDNCEKSFSRKDALKRHRLVKGCGKIEKSGGGGGGSITSPTSARAPNSPSASANISSSGPRPGRSSNDSPSVHHTGISSLSMNDRQS